MDLFLFPLDQESHGVSHSRLESKAYLDEKLSNGDIIIETTSQSYTNEDIAILNTMEMCDLPPTQGLGMAAGTLQCSNKIINICFEVAFRL